MSEAHHQVLIDKLHCNHPSETGHDEVYMIVLIDGTLSERCPRDGYQSMGSGDTWQIGQTFSFSTSCKVEFWDASISSDDPLGRYDINPYNSVSPITMTGSGSSYDLFFAYQG